NSVVVTVEQVIELTLDVATEAVLGSTQHWRIACFLD
ncbi:MAG: hypothetical protein ACI945_001353, partial [Pseudohongiellaceae bacterium]